MSIEFKHVIATLLLVAATISLRDFSSSVKPYMNSLAHSQEVLIVKNEISNMAFPQNRVANPAAKSQKIRRELIPVLLKDNGEDQDKSSAEQTDASEDEDEADKKGNQQDPEEADHAKEVQDNANYHQAQQQVEPVAAEEVENNQEEERGDGDDGAAERDDKMGKTNSKSSDETAPHTDMGTLGDDEIFLTSQYYQIECNVTNENREIVFVHIGKAGGNTVRDALQRLQCPRINARRRPEESAKCFRDKRRPQNPLNDHMSVEIHLGPGPVSQIQQATSFLIAVRNPLSRIFSAYNYLHHNNRKSPSAQMTHPPKELFYKTCFPTWSDLLEAVDQVFQMAAAADIAAAPLSSELSSCQKFVITALRGNDQRNNRLLRTNCHFHFNYEYYYDVSIGSFPNREIFVIRTESIWEDLRRLDQALGGTGVFEKDGSIKNALPGSPGKSLASTSQDRSLAQSRQQKQLCCVLAVELQVYQDIVLMAVNLSPREKKDTIRELMMTCDLKKESRFAFVGYHEATMSDLLQVAWPAWHEANCPNLEQLLE